MATDNQMYMDQARAIIEDCWKDKGAVDVLLVDAVVGRLAEWMTLAGQTTKNMRYYIGLLNQCGQYIGPEAYVDFKGVVGTEVVHAKIPSLVELLVEQVRPGLVDLIVPELTVPKNANTPPTAATVVGTVDIEDAVVLPTNTEAVVN